MTNLLSSEEVSLTIVIVTKDNISDLISTLDSIRDLPAVKILIVNGSNSPIQKNPRIKKMKYTQVIEGPDAGIYFGMNRGLMNVTTRYVWFLNSGDRFLSSAPLQDFLDKMNQKKLDVLISLQTPARKFPRTSLVFSKPLLIAGLKPIPHQSTIFKTSTLQSIGGYDTRYGIEADQELYIRLVILKAKFGCKMKRLSHHKPGGIGDLQKPGIFQSQVQAILRDLCHKPNKLERSVNFVVSFAGRLHKNASRR